MLVWLGEIGCVECIEVVFWIVVVDLLLLVEGDVGDWFEVVVVFVFVDVMFVVMMLGVFVYIFCVVWKVFVEWIFVFDVWWIMIDLLGLFDVWEFVVDDLWFGFVVVFDGCVCVVVDLFG